MKKGIIFDMDGTLWDSSVQIWESWRETLRQFPQVQTELTLEALTGELGKPMDQFAGDLFPEVSKELGDRIVDVCGQAENEYLRAHGAVLYPDLEPVLHVLEQNYSLYIVSNCQQGYIEAFLEYYGWERYFADIECFGNTGRSKGENIRALMERNGLARAVYVGDTRGDLAACQEAHIPFIWASYGFGQVPEALIRINAVKELPLVLEKFDADLFGI